MRLRTLTTAAITTLAALTLPHHQMACASPVNPFYQYPCPPLVGDDFTEAVMPPELHYAPEASISNDVETVCTYTTNSPEGPKLTVRSIRFTSPQESLTVATSPYMCDNHYQTCVVDKTTRIEGHPAITVTIYKNMSYGRMLSSTLIFVAHTTNSNEGELKVQYEYGSVGLHNPNRDPKLREMALHELIAEKFLPPHQ